MKKLSLRDSNSDPEKINYGFIKKKRQNTEQIESGKKIVDDFILGFSRVRKIFYFVPEATGTILVLFR